MIELRPFNWANVGIHYKWNNDEELNFYDSDFPHQNETYDSFVNRIKELDNADHPLTCIMEIFHVEDNELIGVVDIYGIDTINRRCMVEASIGNKKYRNRGLGKLALKAAVQYCFEELGMNKVGTSSFDFNDIWIKIVNDIGFTEEGRLRAHSLKDNEYKDKLIFGMLKSEYNSSEKFHLTGSLLKRAN